MREFNLETQTRCDEAQRRPRADSAPHLHCAHSQLHCNGSGSVAAKCAISRRAELAKTPTMSHKRKRVAMRRNRDPGLIQPPTCIALSAHGEHLRWVESLGLE